VELSDELAAQRRYARWLAWGMRIGLALLVAGLAAYLAGVTPHVPIEQLPSVWGGSARELLAKSGLRPGWHWASFVHRSDMLVVAAIALLASASIACLAAVLPIFRRRGEAAFVAICILQVAVLVLAASGLLAGAH
jgi:hypothetical protein